jgi:dethiobiotin synthetase
MLSIEALKNRNIPFEWAVNLFEEIDNFKEVTQPFYDEVFPNWWSVQEELENFIKKLS